MIRMSVKLAWLFMYFLKFDVSASLKFGFLLVSNILKIKKMHVLTQHFVIGI